MAGTSRFVWYELMTPDSKAAVSFYTSVMGWNAVPQQGGKPNTPYTLLQVGETAVGGLLQKPDGLHAGWMGYIGVDDVDAYADRVKAAGGSVYKDAEDIPGIGRFVVVGDPSGAPFVLFSPVGDQEAPEFALGAPGTVGWRELHSTDWAKAWKFYSELFGWTKSTAMDMGPAGTYQIFKTVGSDDAGAMMTSPDKERRGWQFYFNVADIHAAAEKIVAGGGKVLAGPMEVPGGSFVVQATDPHGGVFAVAAAKK